MGAKLSRKNLPRQDDDNMVLKFNSYIKLPSHSSGGFDHADVHLQSGTVFVAHTANGTVEIIDGLKNNHISTIEDCPEASGVLCAQKENIVFAASRGTGKVIVIDANTHDVLRELKVGPKPNGLAWDTRHKKLLVADVNTFQALLLDPNLRGVLATSKLPGRPRWCIYDAALDLFLVNILDPPGLAVLSSNDLVQNNFLPVSAAGPHGLDLESTGRPFIACDGKKIILLDIKNGHELSSVSIKGEPDVIWYNGKRNLLYCAMGKSGIIEVIDTKEFMITDEIKTEDGAHTIAFNQNTQHLYAFLPQSCRAAVYEEA